MVYGFLSDNRRVLTSTEGRVRVVDTATLHSTDIVVSSDGGSFARVHASPDDRFVAFQHRGIFVTDLSLDAPRTPDRWHKVDDPAETGRPCGWSLDSYAVPAARYRRISMSVGERVDDRGAPIDAASAVRHFHKTMTQEFSNSFGNAITRDGFLYGGVDMRSNVWRLMPATPSSNR